MFLEETDVATALLPELMDRLAARPMLDFERSGSGALAELFRAHGKPGFLVARNLGGQGYSLLQLAQVLRVVAAKCPSLAVIMTMHHHSVAGIARGALPFAARGQILNRIGARGLLLASAFAEGQPAANVLDFSARCVSDEGSAVLRVFGSKRPCSMTHHADLALVGVAMELGNGERMRAMALVETAADGVRREKFWPSTLLAAADNHCLVFDGVRVAPECVLPRARVEECARGRLVVAHAEIALSCLFQLLVSATYLGMAGRMCELVLRRRGGTAHARLDILSRIESASMAVYRLATVLEEGDFSGQLLARAMMVSHNTASQIEQAVAQCCRALGGRGFLASEESQYLVLATRCIDFHPPAASVREEIVDNCYLEPV